MTSDREGGFIILWKRLQSWPLWRSMSAMERQVWITLLFLANWKDTEFWYGRFRIPVRRGQLAYSENVVAREAKVSRKVVRNAYTKLLSEGAIRREQAQLRGQAPYLITIVNYDAYQSIPENGASLWARVGPSEGQGRAPLEQIPVIDRYLEAGDGSKIDR